MANINSENVEKHRQDLTGEYIYGDMAQLVFFLLFMAVWIVDSFFMHFSDVSSGITPAIRIPIGVMILLLAFYVARTGLKIVFGKVPEEPHVIDYSVFRIVRHPIYFSAIMLYFGLLWVKISLLAAAIWILIIIMYYSLSRFEEKLLLKRFGDDYRLYMKKVPMLIPKIF